MMILIFMQYEKTVFYLYRTKYSDNKCYHQNMALIHELRYHNLSFFSNLNNNKFCLYYVLD